MTQGNENINKTTTPTEALKTNPTDLITSLEKRYNLDEFKISPVEISVKNPQDKYFDALKAMINTPHELLPQAIFDDPKNDTTEK